MTISGGVAFGYQGTTKSSAAVLAKPAALGSAEVKSADATNNVKDSGFGMDTASIKLTVVEDLGGGLKATGSISAGGLARGNAVTGEDMTLVVSGGFGSLLLGQIEIGSGIRGLAQAGAPVNNMEGEVLAPATSGTDLIKYSAPAMNGLTFSGSLADNKNIGTGLGINPNLAIGTDYAANKGSSSVGVGVDYANGPLSAKVDYTDWNSTAVIGKANNRIRVAGKYDLGMVAIGAGFENQKLVGGATNKYTMFGLSAPLGAFTVGAAFATNDTSATAGSKTGSTFGVSYALSKRTSLLANMASWEISESAGAAKNKVTNVLLNHNF